MFNRRSQTILLFTALSAVSAGCASIRSTSYSVDDPQACAAQKKHLKGVPTTLFVPTHVHVSVKRSRFGKADENGFVTFVPEMETREVDVTVVKQQEIFGVDFKRPAAGSLAYHLGFAGKDGQFLNSVDNLSDDNTIASVTALVTALIKTVPVKSVTRSVTGGTNVLLEFQEVIASAVFGINDPNGDTKIQEFINTYVNNCHDCTQDRPQLVVHSTPVIDVPVMSAHPQPMPLPAGTPK